MPAVSQKGRRQSDEKAVLIYYRKTLNFMVFWASREKSGMTLNGDKKVYNVKLCPFLFWKYFPMIKKRNQSKNSNQSGQCVTRGRRVHSITAFLPLSRKGTKVI